jgi:hypothetical protein
MRTPAPATRIRRPTRQHLHQRHFALTRHLHQPRLPNRRPHRRRQIHHHQRRLSNQRSHLLIVLISIVIVPAPMFIMLMIVAITLIMTVNTARRPHNPAALAQPSAAQSLHRHAPHCRHRKQHQKSAQQFIHHPSHATLPPFRQRKSHHSSSPRKGNGRPTRSPP